MKFSARRFSKKMLSVILTFALLLSCVAVAFSASAEGDVQYKVVIDSTGTLEDGTVDDEGYTLQVISLTYDTATLYNNNVPGAKALDSAIGKYIELYGENTDAVIYISGNLFTYQFLASYKEGERPFDKTAQLNSLRIEGYNGTTDTFYVEDFEKLCNLYCDLTIDNILFKTKSDGITSGAAGTLTLGKNISATISYVGAHPAYVAGDINLVINGGTYSTLTALDNQSTQAVDANVNYTFNGGSLKSIYTTMGSNTINGNVKYTFNGGEYSAYIMAASRSSGIVTGNTVYEVNDGNYTKANSDVRVFNIQPGSAVTDSGNLAIILNSHSTTGKCITVYDSGKTGYAEGKKEIVVINNAENNLFGFDSTLCSDYLLKVTNGSAYPKFSETTDPAASVLEGFEINYSDADLNEYYTPYIGETSLADYYNEATGLYDLSSFEVSGGMKDATALNITFKFTGGTKVVIDTASELTDGAIVDGSLLKVISTTAYTGNYKNDNTPHKEAIASAVSALVAMGETNPTIYVNGNVYTYSYKDAFAGASGFESLTIEGYNGEEDIFTLEDSEKIWTSCDMIFDNITLKSKGGNIDAMYSNGYTVTFGSGVSLSSNANIGIEKGSAGTTARVNNIIINGGKFTYVGAVTNGNISSATTGDITLNANYKFNGGTFGQIYAGVYSMTTNTGGNWAINGNVYYEFNGGNYNSTILLNSHGAQPITGNTVFVVNGGNYNTWDSNANRRDERSFNIQAGNVAGTVEGNGNIAIVINSWADDKKTTIYNNNTVHFADGKKGIAVINNAEIGYQGFDESLETYPLDYMIKVENGKAMPEFSVTETPADSVLQGFTITPDEGYEDKLVVANGTDILTAADGVYNLSAYEDTPVTITFVDPKALTVVYETVDNVSLYRTEGNYKAPTKAGYVFGGWYSGEGDDYAHTAESLATAITNVEKVYAKFVPASVLKVGWQIPTTTTASSDSTDLRLVSTVDSLKYSNVVFTLTAQNGDENIDMKMESSTVYTKVTGYVDGKGEEFEPTYFSNASYRFMTHKVTGVPNAYFDLPITVTANWTTKDGTYVSGEPTVIYITSGIES